MRIKEEEPEIRRLDKGGLDKFRELIRLFYEVFEMGNPETVDDNYLKQLLENPDFIVFVIIRNGGILGGATAYILHKYYSQSSELFIYDVAVSIKSQRNGLGKKLILALKNFCRENGIGELFVPAHEEDNHALNFYRATGGEQEKVVHFNYTVKPIKED